jgi:hypothetical protein
MKQRWYPVHDAELGTYTTIAPRTGHLFVSTEAGWPAPLALLLGFGRRSEDRSIAQRNTICDLDPCDAPLRDRDSYSQLQCAPDHDVACARRIRRIAMLALRLLNVSAAVGLVHLLVRPGRRPAPPLHVAVGELAAAFGRRSKQDCLFISLCRYAYLRRLNMAAAVVLGVHVPTQKMHAWVQLDGHPLLECPDVLGHYQSCVLYDGADAAAPSS